MNIGNFKVGQTFDKKFSTRKADGSLVTFAGTPTMAVYKDNSTVETTVGLTLTVDFDGRTGLHNVRVVCTDAFYVAGNYDVVVTQGTVDGVNVAHEVVFSFSLEARHPSPNDNADGLLKRDMAAVTGEAAKSLLNALRFLRNKVEINPAGTLMTIYKENGTDIAWTAVVVPTAGADPITTVTPTT